MRQVKEKWHKGKAKAFRYWHITSGQAGAVFVVCYKHRNSVKVLKGRMVEHVGWYNKDIQTCVYCGVTR
jgi:hypothetical protein